MIGRSKFYYALYQIYENLEQYNLAWKYLEIFRNIEYRIRDKININNLTNRLIDYIRIFNKDYFNNIILHNSTEPIFIIGLPSSGIIQLDAILDIHSSIFSITSNSSRFQNCLRYKIDSTLFHTSIFYKKIISIPEHISSIIFNPYDTSITKMKLLDELRNDILKLWIGTAVECSNNKEKRNLKFIIDMNSNLYYLLGFIVMLFPKAKIIHVYRLYTYIYIIYIYLYIYMIYVYLYI